jgi:hypothetical protein
MVEPFLRNFKVKGQINCLFTPALTTTSLMRDGIEVQLWHKSPLDIVFLGKGITDPDGFFAIEFKLERNNPYVTDGKINDVFLQLYYNGNLIEGDNPY